MQLTTTRFGLVDAQQDDLILFPRGLIGFENSRHWILLPDPASPDVAWLQSVSLGHVALPVVSPRKFVDDYRVCVPRRQLAQIHLHSSDQVYILCVLSKSSMALTVNLKSPLVINFSRRLGCQTITSDDQPLAFPLPQRSVQSGRMAA